MTKSKSTTKPTTKSKLTTKPKGRTAAPAPPAPRRAPRRRQFDVSDDETVIDAAPDQPFEEGAHDVLGADLRHRMISEAAYYRYTQRGYADGYDVDDWMAAEAEVDHLLLNPSSDTEPAASR